MFSQKRFWRKTPFFHRAGFEILDQNIGFANQLTDQRLPFGNPQIGRNRFLVSCNDFPLHLFFALAPHAHGVARARGLDLDNLCTHITEQLSAKRSSQ